MLFSRTNTPTNGQRPTPARHVLVAHHRERAQLREHVEALDKPRHNLVAAEAADAGCTAA
jgi:hypothetical protein